MPFIDRIIQYLQSHQGERILLESDQECVIYRPDGGLTETPDALPHAQLVALVAEILPEEHREDFSERRPVFFAYPYQGEPVDVDVTQPDGHLRVRIGPVPPPPPPAPETAPPSAAPAANGQLKSVEHIDELFRLLKEMEASDLHLSSREKPMVRVHGIMQKLEQYEVSSPEKVRQLLWEIAPERNRNEWEEVRDSDFAYELPGIARFRCNIFADRHGPGGVFRLIPSRIVTARELGLTQAMVDLCFLSKGLVLVTGPTGSGKSTTLAALVDHVNKNRTDHIVTIEDPIEFVHQNINCLITQREVHVHTNSFARALRAALREDPDVVLVGEMRDLETVSIAIHTAETGHLVFATLHTTTAASTIDRVIDQFPADEQEQIRVMLSESLKAVIAQTLCRTKDGRRVAAFEVLIVDPACANLIREGKTYQLPSMMQIGRDRGCMTMNDSLMNHVRAGRIEPKEAYMRAVDKAGILTLFSREGINFDLHSVM